jgi:ectoine hydroxylase-related dioxygenase (phytanoyl-CoA dioxygenase family)
MRVPEEALDEVRERGFAVIEGFLADDELAAAQEALRVRFPAPEEYFEAPERYGELSASQFSGVRDFPYRSWDLDRLAFHPDLLDAAERFLGTTDLHLYKVELWAKYAGAADYNQPLHRDFGSHSLVVPRRDDRHAQMTTFIFLSDVTEREGPTYLVPFEIGKDVPFTPLYIPYGSFAEEEVVATAPAGSLLVYRSDILHRGSDLTGERSFRFSLLADYQARGTTWAGKIAWPRQAPQRGWTKAMARASVRERDLFGFPRPGDEYWNDQTIEDVGARYPGMDMTPYRDAMRPG